MTIHPKTRDLARRLLSYEARVAESTESATLLVYEKLRQSLGAFAGVTAFESLAFRALSQAKSEAPDLWAVQVAADGSLQGLGRLETQIDNDKNVAGYEEVDERGVILIARLLGLLLVFLGEALTLSMLRVMWPSTAFDDRNLENGRKV